MKKDIKIPYIPFYFVRHGETDWNKENKVMGLIDIPLNEVGLSQAQIVAKNIADIGFSRIFSSSLKRAKQTAEVIGTILNVPITVIDELKQNNLGVLEGRNKAELFRGTAISNLIEHWKSGGEIEGAESWVDFISRVTIGLRSALVTNLNEKAILIVAHGPTYWALLHILNAQALDLSAKNCGVYYFEPPQSSSNKWTVKALYNDCEVKS